MNEFFVVVRPTASIAQVAEVMRSEGVGMVCICNEERAPIGVITDRDIVMRVCAGRLPVAETQVQVVMTTADLLCCGPEDAMTDVEATMKQRSIGRVLVVGADKRLMGVITMAEIWHYESPLQAGAVSRRVTSREFRADSASGDSPAIWPEDAAASGGTS